jgi:hypothetical protein
MKSQIAIYIFFAVIVCLLFPVYLRLINGPAFKQRSDQVAIREPGKRFLGPPQPVAEEARKDLDFALLSQAAYQRKPDTESIKADNYLDPDATLADLGWRRWENFPNDGLQKTIAISNLRVEVWENRTSSSIAVTFGGTVFTNLKDWKSNVRWFLPDRNDEYTDIVKTLAPAFANEFLTRKGQDPSFYSFACIFSTGHSLGGGLAQQFAYSLPIEKNVRVTKVFAFDPSPVTGFYSVPESIRNNNSIGLSIDRIYERGEILAILRSLVNFFYPPSAENPTIRQVRYNLFSRAPIAGHSISKLAFKLKAVSLRLVS